MLNSRFFVRGIITYKAISENLTKALSSSMLFVLVFRNLHKAR